MNSQRPTTAELPMSTADDLHLAEMDAYDALVQHIETYARATRGADKASARAQMTRAITDLVYRAEDKGRGRAGL